MPKNYNKAKAMLHMKKIHLIALLAQDLEYAGIRDLAKKLNVSPQQLYKDFEKYYGQKYTTGLDKYEFTLRRKALSNLTNQPIKPPKDK
ncbi:MAG TPA: helix-turn-helix transcriptional regulator [Candidatus Dojkabacteria bacterium]|nr:helix-turn-helix transcriptional regulator [Candidatus Dojkabacteria bacterium]HRO65786.1 helix-turn-helix transcriptional regulator [Candidatus Dojkabacteria bacterium]HRP37277.1 helix-turn-helix transcriptional regulator [Candidatus Dojkabacteria bacterium]HRP50787.1 helix-turn-helix transcriptional regulator [Candidatus Dojkabacteria bacterium]